MRTGMFTVPKGAPELGNANGPWSAGAENEQCDHDLRRRHGGALRRPLSAVAPRFGFASRLRLEDQTGASEIWPQRSR